MVFARIAQKLNPTVLASTGIVGVGTAAWGAGSMRTQAADGTGDVLRDIQQRVKRIEADLGVKGSDASMDGFPSFTDKSKSLLKKHLTRSVWEQVKDEKSSGGFTIDRAIQSGIDNQDSGVGVYAGDRDSYDTFAPLFHRVIKDYHGGHDATKDTHKRDLSVNNLKANGVGNPDPEGKYINSTRIRVGRNLKGFGLSPGITRGERREVERQVTEALSQMQGDLSGKYYSLGNMSEPDRIQLVKDHFLFKKGDRFLEAAGCNRDWPEGRGIFHNNEKTFLVWVNEEDQLRIISMQKGGDILEVFSRLSRAIQALEKKLKFDFSENLGYISSCPTNLGTAMRASVHIKLPKASRDPKFREILERNALDLRGIHGEHSESEGGVYDISNKRRLGLSEVECVTGMYNGVSELIALEKKLGG